MELPSLWDCALVSLRGSSSLIVLRSSPVGLVWAPRLGLCPSRGCSPFFLAPCRSPSPVLPPFPLAPPGVSALVAVWLHPQCRMAGVVASSLVCGGYVFSGAPFSVPPFMAVPVSPCAGAGGWLASLGTVDVPLVVWGLVGPASSTWRACAPWFAGRWGLCRWCPVGVLPLSRCGESRVPRWPALTRCAGMATKLKQAFTVECFDDIVLFVPLLAPAASGCSSGFAKKYVLM